MFISATVTLQWITTCPAHVSRFFHDYVFRGVDGDPPSLKREVVVQTADRNRLNLLIPATCFTSLIRRKPDSAYY
jgi:hypothetical protein